MNAPYWPQQDSDRSVLFLLFLSLAATLLATGCTIGPKYQRASAPVSAKWDVQEPWRPSAPQDNLNKGA